MRIGIKISLLLSAIGVAVLIILVMPLRSYSASLPDRHPVAVEHGRCSECHTGEHYSIEHTSIWYDDHRFRAAQNESLCSLCHVQAFCADCHAGKEELKPSEKFTEEPLRHSPHRGDYITRHKIDARIDPAPCFRCHGRANNGKCKICHR
jgi:hypothetical protein